MYMLYLWSVLLFHIVYFSQRWEVVFLYKAQIRWDTNVFSILKMLNFYFTRDILYSLFFIFLMFNPNALSPKNICMMSVMFRYVITAVLQLQSLTWKATISHLPSGDKFVLLRQHFQLVPKSTGSWRHTCTQSCDQLWQSSLTGYKRKALFGLTCITRVFLSPYDYKAHDYLSFLILFFTPGKNNTNDQMPFLYLSRSAQQRRFCLLFFLLFRECKCV